MTRISYLVTAASLAACATANDYRYTPEQATIAIDGEPATKIAIPRERPEGHVALASFGQTEIRAGQRRVPTLHVRLEVANDGDSTPWTVDSRQQILDAGGRRLTPAFASSDANQLPAITIGPREKRIVDLYYSVPDPKLEHFDLLWQVQTAARMVSDRTAFVREAEPEGEYAQYT